MDQMATSENGFTIVELMVSLAILLIFLPFAASMLTNSRLLSSYSKHKTEAAYAAQQIMESQRQAAFTVLSAGQSKTIGPSSVVLDTKGDYNNTSCNAGGTAFCGTVTITITPAVYTSTGGATTTSTTVDHFQVTINWIEQILNLKIPMTETYAEDVVNDPMLN